MRLPVTTAKYIAQKHNLRQVILLAWDGVLTHIVTYGKSVEDCAQAAAGGNMLKQKWGWPECNDQPSRVKKLEKEIADLKARLAAFKPSHSCLITEAGRQMEPCDACAWEKFEAGA